MKNAFLIGERIYLRPLEKSDAATLEEYINDPEVTRTLCVHRPMNLERELEFVERVAKAETDVVLGIAVKTDDKIIGTTGLHRLDFKDRKAEMGISIGAKEEWNKGYGTEAVRLMVRYGFLTLNLNRIYLRAIEHNARAIRVYESVGFRKEGLLRQDCYREGRYWDMVLMSILKEKDV
jgi:[ribosomal protein S5]-alanine N-acetyltransferase